MALVLKHNDIRKIKSKRGIEFDAAKWPVNEVQDKIEFKI